MMKDVEEGGNCAVAMVDLALQGILGQVRRKRGVGAK